MMEKRADRGEEGWRERRGGEVGGEMRVYKVGFGGSGNIPQEKLLRPLNFSLHPSLYGEFLQHTKMMS